MESKEIVRFKTREDWQDALNAAPSKKWIKSRDLGGGRKAKYMPITVQQALADIFFLEVDVIDIQQKVIVNEIITVVKISILPSYPNSDHRIISGVGSKPIQMKSGGLASKFPANKITNSLEYCSPASKSAAVSNALASFANVFGRNIGRKVSDGYNLKKKKK